MEIGSEVKLRRETERLQLLIADRPIIFEEFVRMFDEDDDVELVNGRVVTRMAAQLEHEDLFAWLFFILRGYVQAKDLGIILGSRTAVKIDGFNGRLPDLVFVDKERMNIVREDGIYGAPDLVIEIRSPTDRPSRCIALEADYCRLGVSEIWFIDPKLQEVRVLRKGRKGYHEEVVKVGILRSTMVQGFWLLVDWLWQKPRPKETDVLAKIFGQGSVSPSLKRGKKQMPFEVFGK